MRIGPRAWLALFLTVLGTIGWSEAMRAAIASGSDSAMKGAALIPLAVIVGSMVIWSLTHRAPIRLETEKVSFRLRHRGALTFYDRGTLRLDGGLLVFEGTRIRFAIGHDALLDRPLSTLVNAGARLADAPERTSIVFTGDARTIRAWAKTDSEPTRTSVPLLVMPEPKSDRGSVASIFLYALGFAVVGGVIGGYLDWRGISPPGRPLAGLLAGGIAAMITMIGLAGWSSAAESKAGRAKARAAGFKEAEEGKSSAP